MKVDFQRITFASAPPPKFKEMKGQEWYQYGDKNDFPSEILKLYNESPLHNAIVTQKAQFIAGKDTSVQLQGTVAQQAGAMKALQNANPYESWHDLKLKCAIDLENFGGYAIQAVWNAPGTRVAAYYHLPFQNCRVNKNLSKVFYCEDWAKWRQNEVQEFAAFDPNSPGGSQVFYFKQYRAGEGVYPLPDWYPARTYVEIDTLISDFHYNNIKNGFTIGKIIQIFKGEPTEDIKEEFDRKFKRNTTGTENAGGVIISHNNPGEQEFRVHDISPTDLDKQYIQLADTVRDNIFYAHRVTSPMLFGVRVEGALGGRNELIEAYQVFDRAYSEPKRAQMDRVFTTLFQYTGNEGRIVTVQAEPIGNDVAQDFTAGIATLEEAREARGYKAIATATTQDTAQFSEDNPFGWDDEKDIKVFSQYGTPESEYEELPELFAELTAPEMRVMAVIRDNPKATLEDIAKGARLQQKEAADVLKGMQKRGEIEWTNSTVKVTDKGLQSINDSGGLKTEIFVLYKYGKAPGIGGPLLLDTSRNFCKFMVEQGKVYTREEIDTMSQVLGYDVWKRRGGWRTVKGSSPPLHVPQCRHIWESKLYRRATR